MELLIPVVALTADMIVGDPHRFPHPVQALGWLLDKEEGLARRMGGSLRWWGIFFTLLNALGVLVVVGLLTAIPVLGLFIGVYLAFAGLSLGQLLTEAKVVAAMLDRGDLAGARRALALLVTRDTENLDEQELRKTLAETTSENLCDGFVAPFFFLVVGGPALLWAYKTISTMDSMWGHKTEAYEQLGCFPARADDVLAWLPARLTALFMLGWARLSRKDKPFPFDEVREDASKTDSPNAGWPMAAGAWLAGATMGGPARYHGEIKDKPMLGPADAPWSGGKTRSLIELVRSSALLGAACMYLYALMVALA